MFKAGREIEFAYTPFKWSNNASNNAGVSCTIVGLRVRKPGRKFIYSLVSRREVQNVSPYLVEGSDEIVQPETTPISRLTKMITGNAAYDGGHLFLDSDQAHVIKSVYPKLASNIRPVSGTSEFIDGIQRFCLCFEDNEGELAAAHPAVSARIKAVKAYRETGGDVAKTLISRPHQFRYRHQAKRSQILFPQVSSERREYLPVGYLSPEIVITHLGHAIYDPDLIDFATLSSKLHLGV